MLVSIGEDNVNFRPEKVDTVEDLAMVLQNYNVAPGVFVGGHRKAAHFESAEIIGLDFDDGLALDDALEKFAFYKHIIGTTRSHQKEKHGVVADRFRVILFLSNIIDSAAEYKHTVKEVLKQFPQADKACSDVSRMFYPIKELVSYRIDGKTIDPIQPIKEVKQPTYQVKPVGTPPPGWSMCKWDLLNGLFDAGESNSACMAIATTAKSLGYTADQAYYLCLGALEKRRALLGRDYDEDELQYKVIDYVYSEEFGNVAYNCAQEGTWLNEKCNHPCSKENKKQTFKLQTIDEIMNTPELDWVVDGLFSKGGLSVMAGPPKSGKSTLTRQLTKAIVRDGEFLNRSVEPGSVLYLALEEHPAMLKKQFNTLGITSDDPIYMHVGGVYGSQVLEDLKNVILELRPALVVIDTLLLFLKIENSNSYDEVNQKLESLRDIARTTGTHITCIHHTSKADFQGGRSIMGSQAILGAVDCAFVMNQIEDRRFITTIQRGGVAFKNTEILFDEETETYSLGRSVSETF